MLAARLSWTAAVLATAGLAVVSLRHREPTCPVVIPVMQVATPPAHTRAVPCTDAAATSLRSVDDAPVVCTDEHCVKLDPDALAATPIARPPAPVSPPLTAVVRQVDGHWSACDGAHCKKLGPHLAAHVDASATATLDLGAVVAGDQLWDVATDRTVTLHVPEIRPNGPDRELTIAGDVVLVQWMGACTDMLCMTQHLIDRHGKELEWVHAGAKQIRVDDQYFLTASQFSEIQLRDLHTGKLVRTYNPQSMRGDFIDLERIDAATFGLLRASGDGYELQTLSVEYGDVGVPDHQMVVPGCEL